MDEVPVRVTAGVSVEVWATAGALDLEEASVSVEAWEPDSDGASVTVGASVAAWVEDLAGGWAEATRIPTAASHRGYRGAGGQALTPDITERRTRGTACRTTIHTATGAGDRLRNYLQEEDNAGI